MRIDIWSDIVCPWCAIGKARLDAALAEFEHANDVTVVWRSFELDPGAPSVCEGDYSTRLARKYGTTVADGQAMVRRMTETAAEAGLEFHLERARPGNSFDAHRLVHLAAERTLQLQVKDRFLRGYLSEGEAIGEPDTLARLAIDAGLNPAEVRDVLGSGAYAGAVRADENEALRLGVTAVPLFLIDRRLTISGAHPPAVILQTLHRAWQDNHSVVTLGDDPGYTPVCGPDECTPSR